jgi:hypothetical protein
MTNVEILAEFSWHIMDLDLSLPRALDIVIKRAGERAEKRTPKSPHDSRHRGPHVAEVREMWRQVSALACEVFGVRSEIVIGHRSIPHHCDARHAAWWAMASLGVPQIVLSGVIGRHQNVIGKGISKVDGRDILRIKAEQIAATIRERGRTK